MSVKTTHQTTCDADLRDDVHRYLQHRVELRLSTSVHIWTLVDEYTGYSGSPIHPSDMTRVLTALRSVGALHIEWFEAGLLKYRLVS